MPGLTGHDDAAKIGDLLVGSQLIEQLPHKINPFMLAQQGQRLAGTLALNKLNRLTKLLCCSDGEVKVVLQFTQENYSPALIQGHITAEIQLICQRCNQPMTHNVDIQPQLSPVVSDNQAKQLPDDCEPWVTDGKPVLLAELVEEEILLSLPMFAKHPLAQCPQIGN